MKDILKKQFELERYYHFKILSEANACCRKNLYQEAYSKVYNFFSEFYPQRKTFGGTTNLIDKFKDIFDNKIVVDYGCGYGITTLQIAKYAKLAIGVDVDPRVIHEANKRAENTGVIAKFYTVEEFTKLHDANIDVFFSVEVIEHLHPDDLITHLNESYNKLKCGGCYIIITPHGFNGPHDVSSAFLTKGSTALGLHLKEYTYKELHDVLKNAQFKQIKALLTAYCTQKIISKLNLSIKSVFINIYHKVLLEKFIPKSIFHKKSIAKLFKLDSIWIIARKV